ncbi:hypothetical protein SPFM9_00224 [Salmonella phage SPFM9]|nr:hypothetical protein SPFM9_00224 [Salmonella phage SPFM9]
MVKTESCFVHVTAQVLLVSPTGNVFPMQLKREWDNLTNGVRHQDEEEIGSRLMDFSDTQFAEFLSHPRDCNSRLQQVHR